MQSSYIQNQLGLVLEDVVMKCRPKKIIEFGVLEGYSTIAMGRALKALGRGHIIACDLWHFYDYNHATIDLTQRNVDAAGLTDYVTLWQSDYYEWLGNPCKFDLLHVDISNDGDIIERTLTKFADHIENGAVVVFEGGSKERDEVEWMHKHNRRAINPLQAKFGFEILDERFPSISIAKKR